MAKNHVTVGVDVGGEHKGFHAVALRGCEVIGTLRTREPQEIRDWCLSQYEVSLIGIDAPCLWSIGERSRPAERELRQKGILSYSTPPRELAVAHKTNFYGWVLNGERLYRALADHFPLVQDDHSKPCTFETFPHAITHRFLDGNASGKNKKDQRSKVLQQLGIDLSKIQGMDEIDAALCAWIGQEILCGRINRVGRSDTGFIYY